jgi:hypothetical protein
VTAASAVTAVVAAIDISHELPAWTAKSVSYVNIAWLAPLVTMLKAGPAKTASPSFMQFPLILINGTKSEAACPLTAIVTCLMELTLEATVNELETVAPAKLSIAAKPVVRLAPASVLVTTSADMFIFFPYFFYKRNANGPSLAMRPTLKPFASTLATAVAPSVCMILVRLLFALLAIVSNPPFRFPLNICPAAPAASVELIKLSAAPNSIALIENTFLVLRLGAFRLGAIFFLVGVLPTGTPTYPLLGNYLRLTPY